MDSVTIPTLPEKPEKKRNVDYLYVEADEAHIALQYKETRGDWKGKKHKGYYLAKLVYIHEGHKQRKGSKERAELVKPYYICGTYSEKEENEPLWKQVQEYIEEHYERDRIKKIYFPSDGGSWMKKGMESLGSAFVLDEFHPEKYKKKA